MFKTPIAAILISPCVSLFALQANANVLESVTATPTQAVVGQDVTITVAKSGAFDCQMRVLFGDGQQTPNFQISTPGTTLTHAYASPGVYTITAEGAGIPGIRCTNGPQADDVTIVAGGPPSSRPSATQDKDRTITPLPPRAQPNTDRTIKPLPPKAGVYEDRPLESLFETRMLTSNDPAVRVIECGDDGNLNGCNQINSKGDACIAPFVSFYPFIPGPPDPDPAIFGAHANCPGAVGYDEGTDRYEINLTNGWFISGVETKDGSSSGDEVVDFPQIATGQGVSSASIAVKWEASPGDHARYWIRIEVSGPSGSAPF